MELIGKNIRRYVANRADAEAADGMLVGSLFAGIAFSFARLGNVHAMSHPVSAYFNVPHGVTEDKIPLMAEDAMKSGNIAVNPRSSVIGDIITLYRKAL